MKKYFLLLFIFFDNINSQELKFEKISIEQGLSQSAVYSILQDSYGIMWFGTQDGLNEYDGYGFKIHKHQPGNPSSLSDNEIFSLCEDRIGNLWIGTRGGLNLMNPNDGTFRKFNHDPHDPQSLSSDEVWTVHESLREESVLWIGTSNGGLNRFDTRTGKVIRFSHDPEDPNSLSGNIVLVIYESKKNPGILWIGTSRGGLNKLTLPDSIGVLIKSEYRFKNYKHDPKDPLSLSHSTVWSIHESKSEPGILWIGTWGGGLNKFDPAKEEFISYQNDPKNKNSISSNLVRAFYESENKPGIIWIATVGGGINQMIIPEVIGSKTGMKQKMPFFIHHMHDPDNPRSLSTNDVTAIFKVPDQSGVLWIGTWGGGLNKIKYIQEKFRHYMHDPDNSNSLIDNIVFSFQEDYKGAVWIGTNKGLDRVTWDEFGRTEFMHFVNEPGNLNSLSYNVVRKIYQSLSDSNVLWIGTWGGGLDKLILPKNYSLNTRKHSAFKFIHYQNEPGNKNTLSSNAVSAIYESPFDPGIVWAGTYNDGLNRLDVKTGNVTRYKNDPHNSGSLSINKIRCITEFSKEPGKLLIGTVGGGLNVFDIKEKKFFHYKYDQKNKNSLSDNVINSLCASEKNPGTIWIGTSDGGINKFLVNDNSALNSNSWRFLHFTELQGLPSNSINGIIEDERGFLWISTNNGLSKFDPETGIFRNYDLEDGLQSMEFNAGAFYKASNGKIFFGGINGFNVFHPDSIKDNLNIPRVVITGFQLFNKPVTAGESSPLKKPIAQTNEIILSYNQNHFSFEFASLDYTSPEKNRYAYMLKGFHDKWIDMGNRRYVTFTNLDPGEYILNVKASNNDGIWNQKGIALKIIITPPFWKTWWAYFIYVLAILSSLYYLRSYELNKRKKKEEEALRKQREEAELREIKLRAEKAELQAKAMQTQKEIEKQQIRNRIALDLHDEIGSNLSSISLLSSLAIQSILPKQKSFEANRDLNKYISEIHNAARSSTESIRDIVWFVNPMSDQMRSLIAKMKETANVMLTNIQYEFDCRGINPDAKLNPEVKRNLYLIYKEVLNNIIKHSGATYVKILVEEINAVFRLMIEDNGKGFIVNKVESGNGLKNLHYRAHQINSNLNMDSFPGKGTKLELKFNVNT